jgi:hypothetical protein
MAVRPELDTTPVGGSPTPTPVVDDNVAPVSQNPRSGSGTSIVTPNPVDTVPRTPPASTTTSSGVPTTTSTAVVSGVLVDAYSSKPIVVATPNIISDAVNELAGAFGGGGGGGGGATSDEGGVMEEPKKPNYLVLGLMGLGIYYILKKLL